MAGGLVKYRHLSRGSAHRQALLRNLVTSLVKHEAIHTTWAKAKEAQRMAEKLVTLAKRNNETSRRKVQGILYVCPTPFSILLPHPPLALTLTTAQTPESLMPKVFGELRSRYLERPGGYTRVLRTEPKDTYDQGESAILEFVDGPKDMRFAMTAAAVARDRRLGKNTHNELTQLNMAKVTRYRPDGKNAFETMVDRIGKLDLRPDFRLPQKPDTPLDKVVKSAARKKEMRDHKAHVRVLVAKQQRREATKAARRQEATR
ncbi:ribosomal protein L17 [Xylariaceae sp. FL1272]|nr:ribosomal protein L17 [Xylariaceae sp. FL1272]